MFYSFSFYSLLKLNAAKYFVTVCFELDCGNGGTGGYKIRMHLDANSVSLRVELKQ